MVAPSSPRAEALRAKARKHKQLSGYHRRRARELMAQAAGIQVEHAQAQEVTANHADE